MRVLLITSIFDPEPCYLRGLSFAQELQRRGIEVEVLTGFPNYPAGHLFPRYRQRLCQREMIGGVAITRFPSYISHDSSGLRRATSYLSLAASLSLQGPFRARQADIIHVSQGNSTLCLPAEVIRCIRGGAILLDVADLWPESVLDSGMLRLPEGKRLLNGWCNHTYKHATHIVTLSEGVKAKLLERKVPEAKVSVLYNWCDAELETPPPSREICDDADGLRSTFNVIYAGTIGPLQALGTVLKSAELLREKLSKVRFVLVGTGLEEAELKRTAARRGLENVRFIPPKPRDKLNTTLAFADAVLVHLKNSPLSRVGIPSKLQHCLAVGKPVLLGALGSSAELVERAQAGIVFEPENADQLASAVEKLTRMSVKEREAMGARGRSFYLQNLSFDIGITKLIKIYEMTIRQGRQSGEPRNRLPALCSKTAGKLCKSLFIAQV